MRFAKGTVPLPTDDPVKAEMWTICDNMVISWLTNNLSPAICKSVIYMNTSKDIWSNLEQRFSLTNGSRKYRLSKNLYEIKQNNLSITDYHTLMKTIWEELDAMNALSSVTTTPEIIKLLNEIETQKEETKFFQFLNGLNEVYSPQRSQMLLLTPLPSVDSASAMLQQEEAQRDLLASNRDTDTEVMTMYSKGQSSKIYNCTTCGGKGHTADRCWTVIGYPKWHLKYKGPGGTYPNANNGGGTRGKWHNNPKQQ
ncbi:uncharacterized protein LOC141679630 [Apium graveolens]|uniref:uncharacterized protein LOC141679630 n=1 Tax=Apium graveolens TaxID=4045 RepID=UPI003D7B5B25